jgi:hypothetical protein
MTFRIVMYLLCFFVCLQTATIQAQKQGCTDPNATNFDLFAIENDGSCRYKPVVLTPPFAFELPHEVRENSGLVFHNNLLWTHNDSNHKPILFALDTTSATVVQRVEIANGSNVDWEEITKDETFLYIGDFGNNAGARKDLRIYRLRLDQLPKTGDASLQAEIIDFEYPDQTDFNRNRTHNFDCEAFLALNGHLYLFSKNRGDQKTKLYRLPAEPGTYVAELLDVFDSKGLITASAYNAEYNEITLLGYVNQIWTPFIWLLYDFEGDDFFGGNKRRIDLINLVTTQTEGVCYLDGKNIFISSEESKTFSARVFRFNSAPYTDHPGSNSLSFAGKSHLAIVYDSLERKQLQLHLSNARKEDARIDILDKWGHIVHTEQVKFTKRRDSWVMINLEHLPSGKYEAVFLNTKKTLSIPFELL